MEIKLINNRDEWLAQGSNTAFSQSWEWGEILLSEGRQIERLVVKDGEQISAYVLATYIKIPLVGQYVFCPKGPVVLAGGGAVLLAELKKYFFTGGYVFFRFEPMSILGMDLSARKTIDINPRATLVLDLDQSDEDILSAMHPKTRYNIRLAEKKDVKIEQKKDLDILWKLMQATGERDNFGLHANDHYRAVLASSATEQLVAFAGGQPIATVVLIGHGHTMTYLYGASDYNHRHLIAPYLLQWEAIKLAKEKSHKLYDFFGVAPNVKSAPDYGFDHSHQYAGVTRFKLGFGGKYQEVPGTFDLVIDKNKYQIYKLLRAIRRFF